MSETYGPAAGEYLRMSAERFPERRCFVEGDGTSRTFAEVNARVNRLVDALRTRGIGRGDRIALFATNSAEYAEVLFACLKLGATYMPLNNRLAEREVSRLLDVAVPGAVFLGERYVPSMGEVFTARPEVRLVAVLDVAAAGLTAYETLLREGDDVEPDVAVADNDIVGLAFTSGTTGRPKGVLQSQRMIKNLTASITLDYEIQPDEFRYSSSPMFHIGGQSPVFMHVWRGFPTLVLPQFEPGLVLSWMQTGGLSGCFLVPTMISSLLTRPEVRDADYEQLRSIIYGAAPMPPGVLRRALEVFRCDFVNAFGAGTETGLQTVLGSHDHRRAAAGAEHLLGSIGKPAYGVDLRLVDEHDCDVPRGEVGEVITRNAQTMSGYLDMPAETEQALRGGWFRAGDLARMDDEGYLYLAGRRSDMIIRGGENVYPIEIEDVLCAFPAVAAAAVVGEPDEHWGEVIVAYLVLVDPSLSFDPAAVTAHCRAHLATYKVPGRFVVLDALPMNASGKVVRRELRERPDTGQAG